MSDNVVDLHRFASFFTDKISKLRLTLSSQPANVAMASPHCPSPPTSPPDFSTFRPASESEISKILLNCPNKQCDSDPIPTWLLKECSSVLIPTITNIINLFLSSGHFNPILEWDGVTPVLKKSTLDKEQLSNYRPISNISLIRYIKSLNVL